ncbi:DNA-3-methyladenine glycosylase family protein [Paenibacillus hamazuiensis]|uniref:DNA-3-methyladenine glycosylase family protein n=1 Tax=Paenibacillus hamazuiensis TaxID=2936508 RepID=UPI00200F59E1|nr:DNA-3-methyladenine glycosylase [Paenibacillus hamazuiensis]
MPKQQSPAAPRAAEANQPAGSPKATNPLRIAVPREFRFRENLNYLARSPAECMYRIEDGKIYKLVPLGDGQPLIEISGEEEGVLLVRFPDDIVWPERVRSAVSRYIWHWFDLDTDLVPFYEQGRQDLLLKETVDRFYGLRLMGIPDLFEALCWGIIGQQINLPFAYTLKRRFVEAFGDSIRSGGHIYWRFPSPERIAALSPDDMAGMQMTSRKSEYLIGVARLMAEGTLSKEKLMRSGDHETALKQLVSIRGIGPWTAHYVSMRCLRFPDAFPIHDVGLHNAVKHVLGRENKPTIEELRRLSKAWSGWEAYATFYLWRVLY